MSTKISYKNLFEIQNKVKEEIIRVDHAGELGAKYIYLGQLKALNNDKEVLEMLEGELKHLEFFEDEIKKTGIRPSIFNPIWKKLAFAMGYLSGLHSRKMAMLCTYKVEEVISAHYQSQIDVIQDEDLKQNLTKFMKEEEDHMHIGIKESEGLRKHGAIFTSITKFGIFVSKRF